MKILKKLLPIIGLLYFGWTTFGAKRGVSFESTTTNVQETVHIRVHSLTNLAATASTPAGYDANKKLGSFTSAQMRTFLGTGTPDSTTFLRGDGSWQVPSGSGDVVGPASSTNNNLVRFDGTTGKLIQDSDVEVDDDGNIRTPGTIESGVGGTDPATNAYPYGVVITNDGNDVGQTNDIPNVFNSNVVFNASVSLGASATATTPSVGDNTTAVATMEAVQDALSAEETETRTLQNKTISAANNQLLLKKSVPFVYPSRLDGAGATAITNSYTSSSWGLATFSGSADTNGNYIVMYLGIVPDDLHSTEVLLKNLHLVVGGTDTDAAEFTIAYWSPASSAAAFPTDFTSFSGFTAITTGTLTTPASGDIFYVNDVTLTGWAAGLTAGRPLIVGLARVNGSNDDAITLLGGSLTLWENQ